ncbi:putative membrane protein [Criblamydia sequanensis CRIB-18]|uniref:Membrane protein n=1 Tax=Candidatus Criblamydia sequanensis CRIB-18 TaxID=1437425 RepID=A0A090CYI1_9BACT|nr:putative membrane protein [Criblamydia sequanensis CRIB-18]
MIHHPTKATKVVRQVLFTKQLVENGALIYGTGKEKNIEARLPSKYTLKEINDHGDDTIISVMRYLYDQIRKTEFGLLVYESSLETQNNASYFATAFTIASVAIFIFGLAAYRNLYI